jgi:plasmid maintenance system antidote protein VapI
MILFLNQFDSECLAKPESICYNRCMFETEKVKIILLGEFARLQAKNPHYSMRAYSKKIGISQAAISEILAGKRNLTKKSAIKILEGLSRSPQEIKEILSGYLEEEQPATFKTLDMDSFYLISDWHYYAIMSLVHTRDFKSSPAWVASRLGISKKSASEALELLLRLDLLERDPKTKNLRATGERYEALSIVANPALRKANRQNLELATSALEEIEISKRDFTALTLCFDPERMDEARDLIKKFRRSFDKKMENGIKKEVYKLCIQLFPLTKRDLL